MVECAAAKPQPSSRLDGGAWIWALAIFVATRALVLATAWLAPQNSALTQPDWSSDIPLLRWDAGHYLRILRVGYSDQIDDTTAFFPAYPLAARPLAQLIGPEWALVVTANACGLAAALLLFRWASRHIGSRGGLLCVALWSCYPPALFLSTAYADSLFVLCVVGALLLLEQRRFAAGALLSALATATRPPGVALALVVVVSAFAGMAAAPLRKRCACAALLALVSISGLLAHEAYLWGRYGRWDAYFAAQQSWRPQRQVRNAALKAIVLRPVIVPALRPLEHVLKGQWQKLSAHGTWDALFNAVLLGVAIAGLVRPGPLPRVVYLLPLAVFVLAWLPDPVSGARLYGISRYQLVALPCFLRIAQWLGARHGTLPGAILSLLLTLQCLFMAGFVNWQPVG